MHRSAIGMRRNRSSSAARSRVPEMRQTRSRWRICLGLRRQDKASCLAPGTSFLTFCLHIVFAELAPCAVRCAGSAADAFSFICNGSSAIARNVRGGRDRSVYAAAGISTLLCDECIWRLLGAFRPPIVISWRATKTTFASGPARSAIVVVHGQARAGSAGCADARPASSARSSRPSVGPAATPTCVYRKPYPDLSNDRIG
jgi:hypothetical protein